MSEPRYGVATEEERAGLSGLALLQAMIDGHAPQPPMAQVMRGLLVEVAEGFAVFEGQPDASVGNPHGTVHGGWALTLIDSAAGCAAHTTLEAGVGYTTVETHANFTRPILPDSGVFRCVGRVINRGRSIVTAEAMITDAQGRLLAHGGSTLMVLQPR